MADILSELERGGITFWEYVEDREGPSIWPFLEEVWHAMKASVERAEALRPLIPAGMTMPEMALRFILNEPTVSTIIPGMRKEKHVRANIACSDAGPLDQALHTALRAHRWVRTPTEWSQ